MSDFLTLNDYQIRTGATAVYPGKGTALGLLYTTLGIADEGGEAAGKIKKALRDDALVHVTGPDGQLHCGKLSPERRVMFKKELGDVLWYIARAAAEAGFNLGDVAAANLAKLEDRKERGVLQGSGDDR
jgi:NTP pyrophosphatase (non-canonical NTP hydrolase)